MRIIYEYIWLDADSHLRSKTRVLNDHNDEFDQLPPKWDYDGSSTNQASGTDSEIILIPVSMHIDPFRRYNTAFLVMCETFKPDGSPLENNHRHRANMIFDEKKDEEPWFGIEQEYFLLNSKTGKPLGFPEVGEPSPQGQYYCSVGNKNTFGRDIVEAHLQECIYANLDISGINAEVAPGQWEYQIGPCVGIDSGDQLWLSRYIMERIAEDAGVVVCWDPKPIKGDWNGSGCHTNYSTRSMREGTTNTRGIDHIYDAIDKLSKKHEEHMEVYGVGNEERMTGEHETASFSEFSCGRANRGASVRIGNKVFIDNCGYFEDRRPASNMDPYLVTSKIFETTILNNPTTDVTYELT